MTNKEKVDFVFNYYNRVRVQNILIWLGLNTILISSIIIILLSLEINTPISNFSIIFFLFFIGLLNLILCINNIEKLKFNKNYNFFGISSLGNEYAYSFGLFLDIVIIGEKTYRKEKLNPLNITDALLEKFNSLYPLVNSKKEKKYNKKTKDGIEIDISNFYDKLNEE